MNQTYLNSTKNTVLSLKPSKAIRLLLMVLFLSFYGNANASTISSTAADGLWSNPLTWVGGVVPSSSDDVIIVAGATVEVSGTISIKTVIINGILSVNGDVIMSSPITSVIVNNILRFSSNNGSLTLPVNTTLDINQPGKIDNIGNCSNNVTVIIGLIRIAVCGGNGGSAVYDFGQITAAGGTLQSLPSSDANAPVCSGTPLKFMANKAGADGGTLQFQWSFKDPNGVVTTYDYQTVTIPTPIPGTYKATLTYTTTYGTNIYTSVKTIDAVVIPLPTQPTAVITQPNCKTSTGSLVLSGLPVSGTINQTGAAIATYTITGVTMTISELVAGTYNFTVTNASGCTSTASDNVVIKTFSAVTNTWDGLTWSEPGGPNAEQKLVFAAAHPFNIDIVGCSCQVNNKVFVTVAAGRTLTLTNELNVIAPLGTLAFEYGASLVQINNVATNKNTGDIQYKRSTYSRLTDYNYLASPVSPSIGILGPQYLGAISTDLSNGTFYSYEATATGEDWKAETAATIMEPGKGYIVTRSAEIPQANASVLALELEFSGIPNNGHYEITPIYADKSYLLGNPYPSALNAETFLERNSGVLNGTLYFWTHNTPMQDRNLISSTAGSGAFAYTTNDYATYNATGGVATNQLDIDPVTHLPRLGSAINSGSGGTINKNAPSGKIASGQAFFASTKVDPLSANKIVFDNTMRVGVIDLLNEDNSQFFKTKDLKGKTSNTIEKNRVWLNLTNTQGAFKQTLVGYVTDATNDYEDRFDGESYDGNEFVDFYSVNQDKNLVIQGRALPFDDTDEVQLGFRTTIDGTFTINIDQVDGVLTNQAVFIEDKLTNTIFDLKSGNYTFRTTPGTFNDRFVLLYNNKTLGTENFDSLANKVLVSNANKQIKINSFVETIDKVVIYDLLGRQVFQKTNVNNNELSIANLMSSHQALVVKTLLQNGNTFTDKIIY